VHTNFFINKGNAKASDFLKLMDKVKKRVMKVFGTELEPEIRIMGRNVNG
jgi:UDP-N-acetylmuramate dehydrogenase